MTNLTNCKNGTKLDDGTIWCNDNGIINPPPKDRNTTNSTLSDRVPLYCSMLIAGFTTTGLIAYLIVERFDYLCFTKSTKPKVDHIDLTDFEMRPLDQ